MSWFPRPSSPRAAFADLRAFLRQRSREQRIGAVLSILVTTIIVIVFFVDSQINTAPPPQIVYVESWSRTAPTPRSSHSRSRTRPNATPRSRNGSGNSRRWKTSSACERAETAASWPRRSRSASGCARPQRPQSQCRLHHRQGRQDRRSRRDGRRRPTARGSGSAGRGREKAKGAEIYVTLEPCAHASERGPACSDLLIAAKPARVVVALARSRSADQRPGHRPAQRGRYRRQDGYRPRPRRPKAMAGWLTRSALGRPRVTLKLALSIDGKIALPSGEIAMDHRRGRAPPRSPRARGERHDPGRARDLSRRPRRGSMSGCRASRTSRRAAPC